MKSKSNRVTRREFVRTGAAGALTVPMFLPASLRGQDAPSNLIRVGAIGTGRIARGHDMPGVIRQKDARLVAVSDLDSKRCGQGRDLVRQRYAKRKVEIGDVATYGDYREMLQRDDIDAVIISTPDHWHAKPVIDAVLASKDVYVEKPFSMTLEEGRAMADAVKKSGRILQLGTQQRSNMAQFRIACELVRNGRIGTLQTVEVGLPSDPSGGRTEEMPVPPNLNYDMWLGSTPVVPYTEHRVHPQKGYSRPGWLRCEQFGCGMITGWGVHHVDIAHWGMDAELTGPVEAEAEAEFPTKGLWDVHGPYHVEARYASGVKMIIDHRFKNGVRFVGDEGWIFVTRGRYDAKTAGSDKSPLRASDRKLLEGDGGEGGVRLPRARDHHANWLEAIRARRDPISPAEVAHRSTSACLVAHIAMKLGRKVGWDPEKERFLDDEQANGMIARPQRAEYAIKA